MLPRRDRRLDGYPAYRSYFGSSCSSSQSYGSHPTCADCTRECCALRVGPTQTGTSSSDWRQVASADHQSPQQAPVPPRGPPPGSVAAKPMAALRHNVGQNRSRQVHRLLARNGALCRTESPRLNILGIARACQQLREIHSLSRTHSHEVAVAPLEGQAALPIYSHLSAHPAPFWSWRS